MANSYYYIKLWHEILDDRKMGLLPDSAWRLAIELFLFAGELNQKGFVGTLTEIAWRLRKDLDKLTNDIQLLEKRGIMSSDDAGVWTVINFEKRQERMTAAERNRRKRARDKAQKDNTMDIRSVTKSVTKRNTDIDIDIDITTTPRAREIVCHLQKLCNLKGVYMTDDHVHEMSEVTEWLINTVDASTDDVDHFGNTYWWGKTPPTLGQVKKYWADMQAKKKEVNNGNSNGSKKRNVQRAKPAGNKTISGDQFNQELAAL